MDSKLIDIILTQAPEYWQIQSGNIVEQQVLLQNNSEEYESIYKEITKAIPNIPTIKAIKRHQNVFDLGQFLFREQHLLQLKPRCTHYRVRRFIKIQSNYLSAALKYNVDFRRCGMTYQKFYKRVIVKPGDIVLVIQIITSNLNCSDIVPQRSSDYFVDYIVEF